MTHDHVEPAASAASAAFGAKIMQASAAGSYLGAGTAVTSGLLSNEMGVLVGMVSGVGLGLVSWYYKHQKHKRDEAVHEMKMKQYAAGLMPNTTGSGYDTV